MQSRDYQTGMHESSGGKYACSLFNHHNGYDTDINVQNKSISPRFYSSCRKDLAVSIGQMKVNPLPGNHEDIIEQTDCARYHEGLMDVVLLHDWKRVICFALSAIK